MAKPVMKSIHEFSDYLAIHLGMVRNMKKLSRNDDYIVKFDEVMGERWCSVINANCPSPQQRQAALEERENVNNLYPRVRPATVELLVRLHSLHAYAFALPPAPGQSGGWDLKPDLLHPDNVIKMLNAAIDDTRCLTGLDPENVFFKSIFDQLIEMARWTRTSLNPSPDDRAKVNFAQVTQEQLDAELKKVLSVVCRSLHDFCELYANFPTLPPKVKMQLDPLPWDRKE